MATKILSIISQAHQLAQKTSREFADEPSGNQASLALLDLNNILQQMNVEQMFPFSKVIAQHTFSESKQSYTIGIDVDTPSNVADIGYDRPEFISEILCRSSANGSPLRLVGLALEDVKSQIYSNTIGSPRFFATNNTYPFVEIFFDMKPRTGTTIELIYNKSLPVYTLNDSLSIPPSFNDLLVCALSRRLAINASADLIARLDSMYSEALRRISTSNSRNQILLNRSSLIGDSDFGWSRMESGRELWP